MQMKVKEWGNSQEIRLLKEIRKSSGIEVNGTLDVKASKGVINCL